MTALRTELALLELENHIQTALSAVEDVPKPLRKIAFGIVLEHLLRTNVKMASSSRSPKTSPDIKSKFNQRAAELAKEAGITIEQLGNVFTFKDGKVAFVAPLRENKVADLQRKVSTCMLTARTRLLDEVWVSADALGQDLSAYRVTTNNLNRNLKASVYIQTRGRKKGLEYKLTTSGIEQGLKLIREIANGRSAEAPPSETLIGSTKGHAEFVRTPRQETLEFYQ